MLQYLLSYRQYEILKKNCDNGISVDFLAPPHSTSTLILIQPVPYMDIIARILDLELKVFHFIFCLQSKLIDFWNRKR